MNDENRIINIETKLAHQEFLLEELNQVIYKQQQIIENLEKNIKFLAKQLDIGREVDSKIRLNTEKPPHY